MAHPDLALNLTGYSPDLPTPFDGNGELDLESFARLCRRQIACGAHALVVTTATGECATLSRSERAAIIRCAVEAAGNVPVIAGTMANATAHACALANDAAAAGAAAILSGTPYYNKPTQAGIAAHFHAIADSSRLPIILHDEPGRCVRALTDETVAALLGRPEFIGLCDASGDVSRPHRLRRLIGADRLLLSGDDVTAPAFVAMGGDGCISGVCSIVPMLCHALYGRTIAGDMATAQRLTMELVRLATALSDDGYPATLKCALARLDLVSDTMRLPLVPASLARQNEIGAALSSLHGWTDARSTRSAAAECRAATTQVEGVARKA